MPKYYKDFAQLLNKHLGKKGRNVSWLAREIGMSASTISKWINDAQRPGKPETVIRLAEALELESDERKEFFESAGYSRYWNVPVSALDDEQQRETHSSGIAIRLDTSVEQREQEFIQSVVSKFDLFGLINQKLSNKRLQRPSRVEHFQGREAELAYLLENLHPGRVVTLCGPGGIGKSALASQAVRMLAHGEEHPERFPDGIVSYNFYNQPQVDNALEHIVRSFEEEPKPTPKDAARRVLAGKRALLILESTDNADDLRQILEICDQCGVLITSRSRKDAFHNPLIITPLPQENGLALLTAWSGNHVTDIDAARRIVDIVDGFPLAICLVGHYLAQTEENADEYLVWLEQAPLDALDQGQHQEQSVRLLIQRSLEQVSVQAQQVLGIIGLLALAPFTYEPIAAALNISDIQVRRLLGELVSYNFLVCSAESYIVTHALIYTYARELLSPKTEVVIQLADFYRQVGQFLKRDSFRLEYFHPHIIALMHISSEQKSWQTVIDLAWSIGYYLHLRYSQSDFFFTVQSALVAAQAIQNPKEEFIWMGNLGGIYIELGHFRQGISCYERTLAICKKIGERKGEAEILDGLGSAYYSFGRTNQAIIYYHQSLAIFQEIGDILGKSYVLSNLGIAYTSLGQIGQAIDYCHQSLTVAKEFGDRRSEGKTLGSLGNAYSQLGQAKQAIDYYQQSLTIAKEIGDSQSEGKILSGLGIAYSKLGQREQAIDYCQQSLTVAKEIGDSRSEGKALGNLGSVYFQLGQAKQAIDYFQQSLTIAKELSDRRSEGNILSNLGGAYCKLGEVEQAIDYFQQSLTIAKELSDRQSEGKVLGDLGVTYRMLGEMHQAIDYVQQALEIAKETGERQREGKLLYELGTLYFFIGPWEKAKVHWQESLYILEESKLPDAETVRQRLSLFQEKLTSD